MRLMIVDDEQLTRDSLMTLLPYKAMGIDEVIGACNGRDAYEQALSRMPDILLCDIRMPKMDGLQLSQLLRHENPQIKIIFISGYADKAYLKTAIMLQALGYVEKPIDIAELTVLIKQAIQQIHSTRQQITLEESSPMVDAILRQKLMDMLTGSGLNIHQLRAGFPHHFFSWSEQGPYYCACMFILWTDPLNIKQIEETDKLLLASVIQTFHADHQESSALVGLMSPRKICVLFNSNLSESAKASEYFIKRLNAVHQQWKRLYAKEMTCSIGYSLAAKTLKDISTEYQRVTSLARWQVFLEKDEVLPCSVISPIVFQDMEMYKKWRAFLYAGDAEGARLFLNQMESDLRKGNVIEIEAVRKFFEQLLQILHHVKSEMEGKPDSVYTRMGLLMAYSKLHTLSEIVRFMILRLNEMFPELVSPKGISLKVAQIIGYISAHLGDPDLSIQTLAQQMSLTENYLCALFKKETGSTVAKSITDARIERSKRLLMQDIKLYEVAEKVGYADPNYFSAVFKKQTGLSPTVYRRRQLHNGMVNSHEEG